MPQFLKLYPPYQEVHLCIMHYSQTNLVLLLISTGYLDTHTHNALTLELNYTDRMYRYCTVLSMH